MRETLSKRFRPYLTVAVALAWMPYANAQSGKAATFEAGLVRCADVTEPTRLTNCGTDPLQEGVVEISEEGELEVQVVGAAPRVVYSVAYRSLNGSGLRVLGEVITNAQGNGHFDAEHTFAPGQVGSGNVVLRRAGRDQCVTGFKARK